MSLRVKQASGTLTRPERTLLLLPSATYSVVPNWDLEHGDASVMEAFAGRGWTVCALDLPGYGESMDPRDPESFGAARAAAFIEAAGVVIEDELGSGSFHLLGWSWGSQAAGLYATVHPERVRSLVLYGFTHGIRVPAEFLPAEATRPIDLAGAKADFVDGCHDPQLADAYAAAVVAADDAAPAGPLRDYVLHLPLVDPVKLTMPTLVVCGQYEVEPPPENAADAAYKAHFDARRADLDAFCAAQGTELVIIDGGGHAVHLETPRQEWLWAVEAFLCGR